MSDEVLVWLSCGEISSSLMCSTSIMERFDHVLPVYFTIQLQTQASSTCHQFPISSTRIRPVSTLNPVFPSSVDATRLSIATLILFHHSSSSIHHVTTSYFLSHSLNTSVRDNERQADWL